LPSVPLATVQVTSRWSTPRLSSRARPGVSAWLPTSRRYKTCNKRWKMVGKPFLQRNSVLREVTAASSSSSSARGFRQHA